MVGDRLKPALIKILPKSTLKKIKSGLVKSVTDKNSVVKKQYRKNAYPPGVNLIGFIKAQMGLGEGCRLIAKALEKSGIDYGIIDTRVGNPFNHNDNSFKNRIISKPKYSINIIHVNPEQFPSLVLSLPQNTFDKRYNIAIWLWELPEFPPQWLDAFRYVDEVWAVSRFCHDCFVKVSPVPVTLIPYGLSVELNKSYDRKYFSLPYSKFLFLIMFDTNSTMERKNPVGAIRAFKNAFTKENKQVGLVIKINNCTEEARKIISEELKGYENIFIIDRTLSKDEIHSLIKCCDVFVSLHRSEGFGLVIAEAMLMKTPVIATFWSANVDFMSHKTACCVDYKEVELTDSYSCYTKGQYWAEPDVIQASVFMKLLFQDREFGKRLTENAYRFMTENYSVQKSSEKIKNRLNHITGNFYHKA